VTNEFTYRFEMTPIRIPAPADSRLKLMHLQMQY
jgi:hypothetical protein